MARLYLILRIQDKMFEERLTQTFIYIDYRQRKKII